MAEWCTIESDPGVFSELIERIGVRGVQVEELWSLDADSFAHLEPLYGLVFLFKWKGSESDGRTPLEQAPCGMFFARQIISNACATQAILSILLNCDGSVDIGSALNDFKQFSQGLDPVSLGESINGLDSVRVAHNSFARPEAFVSDGSSKGGEKDDVFHFIAYVPFGDKVYELDGLKSGPILLGDIGKDMKWVDVVRPHIQSRIDRYSGQEIRFNLLGLIKDQRVVLQKEIVGRKDRVDILSAVLFGQVAQDDDDFCAVSLDDDVGFEELIESGDLGKLFAQEKCEKALLREAEISLKNALEKSELWKVENIRRRHNYVPFVVRVFEILARKEKLAKMLS